MLATLADTKIELREVLGSCPDSERAVMLINKATRRLMRRGDWSGTVVPIHVCVRKGCVVWPRYVGQVRKINFCKHPIPIKNVWYDFLDNNLRHLWCGWLGSECNVVYGAKTPTFNTIFGDNRTVRAYAKCNDDLGKTIRIFGVDNNDQPLQTNNGDGTWSDGIIITLQTPFGSTNTFVRRIDRVLKEETQCNVFLYAYNAVDDVLEDLAVYEPSETNPSYERVQLNACGGNCGDSKSIVALVKLRFIPAKFDNDLVLIENPDALSLMVQSIRYEEQGARKDKVEAEQDAVRELNLQLRDDFPEDQMPVEFAETGGTSVGFQQMF